jgi:hypothetical protein
MARLRETPRLTKECAQFCAHPTSKTIANGSEEASMQIATTGAENQRGSKPSQSVLIVFGRSLNQRVAGSSPARLTSQSFAIAVVTLVCSEVGGQCLLLPWA